MHTTDKVIAITEVQRATEKAMAAVIAYLQSTPHPQAEVAHTLIDTVLTEHNCSSPEGHIVAGGIASHEPHELGEGALLPHTPIVIDIFPQSRTTSYFADMTRTVCLGTAPKQLRAIYNAVREAQLVAANLLKPGTTCATIQAAVEKHFIKAGYATSGKGTVFPYAEGFVHGVGHGVSTVIHDTPHLNNRSKDVLKAGNIITIEPGLYYKDTGGVRLEDMYLITETGARLLTDFPYTLEI